MIKVPYFSPSVKKGSEISAEFSTFVIHWLIDLKTFAGWAALPEGKGFSFSMKYSILINQIRANEWGLNLSQAALFSFCFELPSWADPLPINGEIYYYSSKNKIVAELPILTEKPDTIYRLLKQLEEKKLIMLKKIGNKDFIKLNPICKDWASEKNPNSENFPGLFGKKSENASEKNPTNNNTIVNQETNDSGGAPPKSIEEIIKEKKIVFCKRIIDWVKRNPNKYPKQLYFDFAKHWLELSQSGKKMRFEGEKYFEHGKRLSTWMGFCKDEKLSEYWAAERNLPPLNEMFKTLL